MPYAYIQRPRPLDGAFDLAGATRIELATSGVTGFFEFNDFNNFVCLLYQIVVKCVES